LQGVRSNGANPMTIAGGHAIDAMCAVLSEFADVSARIPESRNLEGSPGKVDAPDCINVIGRLTSSAELRSTWPPSPSNPGGKRLEMRW
jgi:hypothetical protein